MKTQINLPQVYENISEEEKILLDGGSWSYAGKSWNDSPLYATKITRAEYEKWGSWLRVLVSAVKFTIGLTGPIGKIVKHGMTLAGKVSKYTKDSSFNGWTYCVQFCFQDGLHSNMYVSAYSKGNEFLGFNDPWIYTN